MPWPFRGRRRSPTILSEGSVSTVGEEEYPMAYYVSEEREMREPSAPPWYELAEAEHFATAKEVQMQKEGSIFWFIIGIILAPVGFYMALIAGEGFTTMNIIAIVIGLLALLRAFALQ